MKEKLKIIKRIADSWLVIPETILKKIFKIKRDTVDHQIPWITHEAREWLENYLKKEMIVFEWGSGGSTLFIAPKVKKIISIEYNKTWYKKVKFNLKLNKMDNCQINLIKPKKDLNGTPYSPKTFNDRTSCVGYSDFSFTDYCQSVDSFPDNYFDLIIVDGRARNSCILHAHNKIKEGGYLMLDNSEHEEYNLGISKLANFDRSDFFGPGPFSKLPWGTSIFLRKK